MLEGNIPALIASPARGYYLANRGKSSTVDDRLYYWSGDEWVIVSDPKIAQNHIQVMSSDRQRGILYLGVGELWEPGELLFSIDGGVHWERVPGWKESVGGTPLVIRPTHDGYLVVDVGRGIYVGDISGESWSQLNMPEVPGSDSPFRLLITSPENSKLIFIETIRGVGTGSGIEGFVYVTEDRGKSWREFRTSAGMYPQALFDPEELLQPVSGEPFSWDVVSVWTDPLSNGKTVWTIGVIWDHISWDTAIRYYVGYRSSDEGESWQPRFRTPDCINFYQNTVAVADEDVIVIATEGDGVFFTNDGGDTWSAYTKGLPLEDRSEQD
jgi:photosystem II stability/assembly factor-like uncharacterized protein